MSSFNPYVIIRRNNIVPEDFVVLETFDCIYAAEKAAVEYARKRADMPYPDVYVVEFRSAYQAATSGTVPVKEYDYVSDSYRTIVD